MTMPLQRLYRGERIQTFLAMVTLSLALVCGGGQGTFGDTAAQLSALALLGLVAWRHFQNGGAPLPGVAWLAVLPFLLPLLQLLPLPLASSARTELAGELSTLGLGLPARISLITSATERALFWLLPAAALFLATLQMDTPARQRLLTVFLVIAVASVVLGIAQLAGGPGSPLRFYAITNSSEAVGLFANRNHFASLLVMALPLVLARTALVIDRRLGGVPVNPVWIAGGAMAIVLLTLGIAMTRSRTGLLLGMLAIALSVPGMLALRRRRGMRRLVAALVALSLLVSVQFALLGILQRFEKDPLDNARLVFAKVTAEAAAAYQPFGTGLGGFRPAYQPYEAATAGSAIVNHAHNDYAELWLEGGWPALLLGAPLFGALLWSGWRVWHRLHAGDEAGLLSRAAWISLAMVLLHSLVDYPLRTTANLAVFGLLSALVLADRSRASEFEGASKVGLH